MVPKLVQDDGRTREKRETKIDVGSHGPSLVGCCCHWPATEMPGDLQEAEEGQHCMWQKTESGGFFEGSQSDMFLNKRPCSTKEKE